jgi:hypothetical protein
LAPARVFDASLNDGWMRADDYDDRMTTTTMAGLVACFG